MCAENTICDLGGLGFFRNYLRVRGEYEQQPCSQVLTMELPPRARRIRDFSDLLHHYLGTTSACAENTDDHASEACHTRNYLRVRGEYMYRSIAKPN